MVVLLLNCSCSDDMVSCHPLINNLLQLYQAWDNLFHRLGRAWFPPPFTSPPPHSHCMPARSMSFWNTYSVNSILFNSYALLICQGLAGLTTTGRGRPPDWWPKILTWTLLPDWLHMRFWPKTKNPKTTKYIIVWKTKLAETSQNHFWCWKFVPSLVAGEPACEGFKRD